MNSRGCPIAHEYLAFSPGQMANHYTVVGKLREETPVAYSPDLDAYLVTRYEDILQVFGDRETFSAQNAASPFIPLAPEAQALLTSGFPRIPTLMNADPPRHPPMRNSVSRCLTPARFEKVRPAVRVYAENLIRNMADQPVCDFVAEFAYPLPAFAGFSLLGFPREDTDMVRDWCGERVSLTYGRPDLEGQMRGARDQVAFWDYCVKFIELRQRQPADDLTSDLLALSGQRGDLLNLDDIRNMVYAIALAAHDTTTTALTNGVKNLLLRPQSWEALKADPSLIPNAVEELMRFDGPMVGHRRKAMKATEIGGCPIPEGAVIVMLVGSANHDERKFGPAEEIELQRENASEHFAFGHGFHKCLGAPLARWEFALSLELLTKALPDMRLVEDQAFEYKPLGSFRSLSRLLIEPRGAAAVAPRQATEAVRQPA